MREDERQRKIKEAEKKIDELGRVHKDIRRMSLCFEIARSSFDPSSKHGCVIYHQDGAILSGGYNGPPQGAVDLEIPTTRPEKYDYFEHSERNAIYMAGRRGVALKDSIFYVTGFPCVECMRAIIQIGAFKLIYGPYNSVMTDSEAYLKKFTLLLKGQKLRVERFKYDKELYEYTPRIKTLIENKKIADIRIENNFWKY